MFHRNLLLVIFCLLIINESHQYSKNIEQKSKNTHEAPKRTTSRYHFTSGLIIFAVLLFMVVFLYGTRCFLIVKMHFFEKREKKYIKMDKMDLTSNV